MARVATRLTTGRGVMVAGGPPHSRCISGLDHVEYVCAAPDVTSPASARLPLRVVAGSWNEDFVVFDKPSGMSVIPCARSGDSVVQRLMGLGLTSESIRVVHRLDKMTHGLLCVGLSRSTGAALAKSLVAKSWRKLYRVLCTVPPPALRATFVPEAPIGGDLLFERGTGALRPRGILESYLRTRTEQSRVRHPFLWNNMLVESVPKPSRPVYPGDEVERPRTPREERKRRVRAMFGPGVALGRISRTEFTLQGTGFDAAGRDVALYIARLLTGRTHQLRVHFSDAGAPIVGDYYYNPLFYGSAYPGQEAAVERLETSPLGLQAFGVQFPHPGRAGAVVEALLPPPETWRRALRPDTADALFSHMHAFDLRAASHA